MAVKNPLRQGNAAAGEYGRKFVPVYLVAIEIILSCQNVDIGRNREGIK
jgi:hypothetical protein